MTDEPESRTYADIAREVAAQYGLHDLTDDDCEYLLWECSPYPVSLNPDVIERALHRTFSTESATTSAAELTVVQGAT